MSFDCTIRDLSDNGARVLFRGLDAIPSKGWLINISGGRAHACETVWRAGRLRGLKFTQTLDVTRAHPDALNHLHRLWVEAAAR